MIERKFNYYKFGAFCLIVLLIFGGITFGVVSLIKNINYKKSYEYKLINIGYSLEEYKKIDDKLDDNKLEILLSKKYNENTDDFVCEKYFLFSKLDSYLNYKDNNKKKSYKDIVTIINTESDIEWIDEQKETDTSKKELMLVNRLYGLNSEYTPEKIIDVPLKYAYANKTIDESILENIISFIEKAKESEYSFVVSYGYRSYAEQEKLYKSYVNNYGQSEADKVVAMPGHSEYQTGLVFDLEPYNKIFEDPYNSEEYNYLKENAHKYGFIIRLPKGKEEITGFSSSAWKLRYVGEEAATIIYEEDLTFEEYYAYYVIGDKDE